MRGCMRLNPLHKEMLRAGTFHLDGWNSDRGKIAAQELYAAGLVQRFDSGSDQAQYTCWNYKVTEAGQQALKAA